MSNVTQNRQWDIPKNSIKQIKVEVSNETSYRRQQTLIRKQC
jgi:hypothetical protein